MMRLPEKEAYSLIPSVLAELMGSSVEKVSQERCLGDHGEDLCLESDQYVFRVEYKSSSARAPLFIAQHDLLKASRQSNAVPLIVVPYMSESGRQGCEKLDISWLDLSGNAHIRAPGLFIHVEGRPNRFKSSGRPRNLFAPKSSRIARCLLIHFDGRFTQRQISQITGMDEGHVSRIVKRLEQEMLILKDKIGEISVPDPNQLLKAWHESYDFGRHHIVKGHVAGRSGDEVFQRIAEALSRNSMDYASTGLGAAWLYSQFASFRLTTFFVKNLPADGVLESLNFREDERGANTWFVIPNDEGVFYGTKELNRISCVHPVQVYLDLKGQPERALEAAEQLKSDYLNWK